MNTLIPQEYQPYAYNGLKAAKDANPKLYEKSNLIGRMAATLALRNVNAGAAQGMFGGSPYAPQLERLATQGLTLGMRQGMLAATGQPTDEEWAESEEAKRALYEAYGQDYTPQKLRLYDRLRNVKDNAYAGAAGGIKNTLIGDMIGANLIQSSDGYGIQPMPAEYARQGMIGAADTTAIDPKLAVYNDTIRYIAPGRVTDPFIYAIQGNPISLGSGTFDADLPGYEAYRDGADRLLLQDGADSGIMGTEIGAHSNDIDIHLPRASDLVNSQTVQKHMLDIVKRGPYKGELSRPYIDTNGTTILVDEIMNSSASAKDIWLENGMRWEVPGVFRNIKGTWELVVDLDNNIIVHLNFVR